MIVYMHIDDNARITACGFKSSRSATNFIARIIPELASYHRKRMADGSVQELVSAKILSEVDKLTSSAKGSVETVVAALQQAIDLYEGCIGNTSPCHTIEEVNIVS